MSDRLRPPRFETLARWVLGGLDKGSILDLPRAVWFEPPPGEALSVETPGGRIATPFGVAAGPHTQLAGGLLACWLCGGRALELKTVQRRAVEVSRPCIRIRDEGLNVEWSQELTADAAFDQYLDAWVLVHAVHRLLGWAGEGPETIFDISVGYDLEGLLSPEMQRYLELVADAGERLDERLAVLEQIAPELGELEVPRRLASQATISTMHGCPPDEIGRMAEHLMAEHGLHARVKLNPTLLGAEAVREIVAGRMGWDGLEPDEAAFAADLRLDGAVALIDGLERVARQAGVAFGVKLSNTLPVVHDGRIFQPQERTMYLSGRALHPLTVQVAARLREACGPELPISFCGGADAWNAPDLAACGLTPVTTCSDLLKPGGIARLTQYAERLREALDEAGAAGVEELIVARAWAGGFGGSDVEAAAAHNLVRYAAAVLDDPAYRQGAFDRERGSKGPRPLGPFDCIAAPCVEDCAIDQDVPEYMRRVAAGDRAGAAAVIRTDNALPVAMGRTCHHPCEPRCVRGQYDEPLAIREIKRFAVEAPAPPARTAPVGEGPRVAIVGAGPCGLAAARDLRRAGADVTVFEARSEPGGMITATIPAYRAPDAAVARDLTALQAEGVKIRFGVRFGRDETLESLRAAGFDAVVLSAGAQKGARLGIPGENAGGVWDGLELLRRARRGAAVDLGKRLGIIGGGDVAVDCARTARRLGVERVEILYRRRLRDMPAQAEEIRALTEEGVVIRELLAPAEVETADGRLVALRCLKMRPGEPGPDGRPRPVPVPGAEETVPLDTLVVAIGQALAPEIAELPELRHTPGGWIEADPETGRTAVDGLWVGGDLVRGPSSIVVAAGDGRRIAADILRRFGVAPPGRPAPKDGRAQAERLLTLRARRDRRVAIPELGPDEREGFAEVVGTLDEVSARNEAARCLECDLMCSTCVTVCPNRAFLTYELEPLAVEWPRLIVGVGGLERTGCVQQKVEQPLQVAVVNDLCNACGNCTEFCPTAGLPHEDKPRLLLDPEPFESFHDNAVLISNGGKELELIGRFAGATHRLAWGDRLRYRGPLVDAELDPGTAEVLTVRPAPAAAEGNEVDWSPCLTLLLLARGLRTSHPDLIAAVTG